MVQSYKPGVPKELIDNDKHCKILWMDETTIHGAPYMEVLWYYKPYDFGPNSHYHEEDEFLGFVGSDPLRPHQPPRPGAGDHRRRGHLSDQEQHGVHPRPGAPQRLCH